MAGLKKILLVDDEEDLREALAEQLVATDDFDVTEAGSGAEAVEATKNAPKRTITMRSCWMSACPTPMDASCARSCAS